MSKGSFIKCEIKILNGNNHEIKIKKNKEGRSQRIREVFVKRVEGVGVGRIPRGSSGGEVWDKDRAAGLGRWAGLFQGARVAETRDQVEKQQEMKDWKTLMATEGDQVYSPA